MSKDATMVPLARSTDALGSALRRAFAVPTLPDDMTALLRHLDHADRRH